MAKVMGRAINLDHQLRCGAIEVRDIGPDRMLAAKAKLAAQAAKQSP
jgi:hypothetical protein